MLILGFWHSMTMLALECGDVINLRLARLAGGGDTAVKEFQLMIVEKVDAGFEAGATLGSGGTPRAVIERYREHVADNARRLSA